MKITAYEADDVVKCEFDTDLGCIYVKWDRFVQEHVRPCLEAHYEPIRTHGGKGVIVDTKHTRGALSAEDRQWVAETFFPEMARIGVKGVITIVPESAVTRLSARNWTQTGQVAGIRMIDAASYDDAMSALKSL